MRVTSCPQATVDTTFSKTDLLFTKTFEQFKIKNTPLPGFQVPPSHPVLPICSSDINHGGAFKLYRPLSFVLLVAVAPTPIMWLVGSGEVLFTRLFFSPLFAITHQLWRMFKSKHGLD